MNRHRLKRIIEARETALDREVAGLAEARAAEREIAALLNHAEQELEAARRKRQEFVTESGDAGAWSEHGHWEQSRRIRVDATVTALTAARDRTGEAATRVAEARTQLEQILAIERRLDDRERAESRRSEQRITDEHSARISGSRRP